MIIVSAKRTWWVAPPLPGTTLRSISRPFDTAVRSASTTSVTPKTALKSGSSQHGNARLQSVDCICDVAITRSVPSSSVYVLRYQPRS